MASAERHDVGGVLLHQQQQQPALCRARDLDFMLSIEDTQRAKHLESHRFPFLSHRHSPSHYRLHNVLGDR